MSSADLSSHDTASTVTSVGPTLLLFLLSTRDLPVCWLAAKENAFNDCSHDIVLHHGSSPFATRDNAKPIDMRLVDMNASGYTVR